MPLRHDPLSFLNGFVHWLTDKVYDGRITQNVRDQFRSIVEGALHQLVHDKVRGRLSSALQEEQASAAQDLSAPTDEEEEEEELPEGVVRKEGEVVTLEEELEGFQIVQAILREVVDADRVAKRDLKSYLNVLLDDTNRQPICRFHLHSKTKRIGLLDEEKNEERDEIETLGRCSRSVIRTRKYPPKLALTGDWVKVNNRLRPKNPPF